MFIWFIYKDSSSWHFWIFAFIAIHSILSLPSIIALLSHIRYAKNIKIRSTSDSEIILTKGETIELITVNMSDVVKITTTGSPACIKEDRFSLLSWDGFFFVTIYMKHGQNYIISSFYDANLPKLGALCQRIIPIVLERDVYPEQLEDYS